MKRIVTTTLMILLLTGCSLEANIYDLAKSVDTPVVLSKSSGLVSGSTQHGTATGGYQVQSTLGNYHSHMDQTTTDNSYKVYSSVQSSLLNR